MWYVPAYSPFPATRQLLLPGFDLFRTTGPTNFAGVDFEGVPLGTFDFGDGNVGVGNADTIVERLDPAEVGSPPGTDTIDIELVALQLRSVTPVDLGAGSDFHYITLQLVTPSTGTMDITFDSSGNFGTFDSAIDVFFDIRIGALHGTIIFSDVLNLSSSNVFWDRNPPPGAVLIAGVNHLLAGDSSEDFFPEPFTESHPSGAQHSVTHATPEPTSLIVWLLLGTVGLTIGYRRRQRVA